MFITDAAQEFEFPVAGLGDPRLRYWRLLRLSLARPWYVLTIEHAADGEPARHTVCVAWDTDLVDFIDSLGSARALALTCIRPRRSASAGHWTSWDVHEVWLETLPDGSRRVVFLNQVGQAFGDGLSRRSYSGFRHRRLVARLPQPSTNDS